MTITASEIPNEILSSFVYRLNHFHPLFQACPSLMFCWRISEYPVMLSWGFKLKFVSFQEDFFSYLFYSSLFFPSDISPFSFPCTQSLLPVPAGNRVNCNSGIHISQVFMLPYGGHAVNWPLENSIAIPARSDRGWDTVCCEGGRRNAALSPKINLPIA